MKVTCLEPPTCSVITITKTEGWGVGVRDVRATLLRCRKTFFTDIVEPTNTHKVAQTAVG